MRTIEKILTVICILLFCSVFVLLYEDPNHEPVPEKFESLVVYEPVTQIKNVPVYIDKIIVKEKKVFIEVMPELKEILKDDNKQVTTVSELECPEASVVTVASVMDTETGQSELVARVSPEPIDIFAIPNDFEAGVRAGYLHNGGLRTSTYLRWTFARVSTVHTSLYIEANSAPEAMAMIELGVRW